MKNIYKNMNLEIKINDEELYNPAQVGKILNLSAFSIRKYIREGKIKGIKYNGYNVRVKGSDLKDYINSLEIENLGKSINKEDKELIDTLISFLQVSEASLIKLIPDIQEVNNITDSQEKYNKCMKIKKTIESSFLVFDNTLDFIDLINDTYKSDNDKDNERFIEKSDKAKENILEIKKIYSPFLDKINKALELEDISN